MTRILLLALAELLALLAHGLHKLANVLIDGAIWLRQQAGEKR